MRFRLETRYADYNTKGHVNNAVYLPCYASRRSVEMPPAVRAGLGNV